jgi:hypothetical protein
VIADTARTEIAEDFATREELHRRAQRVTDGAGQKAGAIAV